MKITALHTLIVCIWLSFASISQAAIVTFESTVDSSANYTPAYYPDGENLTTEGLTFEALASSENFSIAPADWVDDRSYLNFANNGTNYLRSYTNSGSSSLGIYSNEYFLLTSIDLAEYGSTSMPSPLESVLITGYKKDGGTVQQLVQLDNIVDGAGGQEDFQTILFGNSWTDLYTIELGPAEGAARNIFSLDNIVYESSGIAVVPIPSAIWFFVTGVGVIAAIRKRIR